MLIHERSPGVGLRLAAATDRVARDDELEAGVGLRVAEEGDDLRLAHPVDADPAHLQQAVARLQGAFLDGGP